MVNMITARCIANNLLVSDAINSFLFSLKEHTRRNYSYSLRRIFTMKELSHLISLGMRLDHFTKLNFSSLLDIIKICMPGSETTKQNRCSAFLSFTKFLSRHSNGNISPALPQKGINPTFQKIREKSVTIAMNADQCFKFLSKLHDISYRDYLIAKCILQGAKRISEVTEAKVDQIDWDNHRITFVQKKSHVLEKQTVITYPKDFMNELKFYINDRKCGPIFITRTGQRVSQPHLYNVFVQAGIEAGIPFRVHPHALRATAITLLMKMGYHSDQILNI